MKIAVIDYGAGNLSSVVKALAKLGYSSMVTDSHQEVLQSTVVIFPGVGAAAEAMSRLRKLGMVEALHRIVKDNRPFLGICLGLQLLLTVTEEGGKHKCLGFIPGTVKRLPQGLKVPHIGWNQVRQKLSHPLFEGIPDNSNFYFVHSYYGLPQDSSVVAAETDYGITFPSIIIKGNLVATQFHPEKSGTLGLKMLENFLKFSAANIRRIK